MQSAFLKADTLQQLLVAESGGSSIVDFPRAQVLKIKLEEAVYELLFLLRRAKTSLPMKEVF